MSIPLICKRRPHNREKYVCRECGGAGICEHNRMSCGGSSICEHGRRSSQCHACEGSSIYEHNRMRYSCVICGGAGICEHGRMRSHCKSCGGSAVCEHGRRRSQCKRCGAAVRGASTKEAQHKPRQTRAPSTPQQLYQDDPATEYHKPWCEPGRWHKAAALNC